jgi:FlaA1/EpsC-like NDP-sugar epimerase
MFTGKRIMIIGGTGSLGNSLTEFYLKHNNEVIIFSRDENKQWSMKSKFPSVTFIIGDMRNISSLEKAMENTFPNIVIIAGALKHVDICENNISECINTNILGVKNVIDTVVKINGSHHDIETCLLISTDKSCSPINSYGMSKSISERLIAETSMLKIRTKFLNVRYGNVLTSRGSILPKFKEIGENKTSTSSFPITDYNMTRFFMTLDQSVKLINTAIINGDKGDTWIPCISSFKISDIANYFSKKYDLPVLLCGIRPGEKIHECLINQSELYRTIKKEIDTDTYFVIKTCYTQQIHDDLKAEYTSENISSVKELEKILNLLD